MANETYQVGDRWVTLVEVDSSTKVLRDALADEIDAALDAMSEADEPEGDQPAKRKPGRPRKS